MVLRAKTDATRHPQPMPPGSRNQCHLAAPTGAESVTEQKFEGRV